MLHILHTQVLCLERPFRVKDQKLLVWSQFATSSFAQHLPIAFVKFLKGQSDAAYLASTLEALEAVGEGGFKRSKDKFVDRMGGDWRPTNLALETVQIGRDLWHFVTFGAPTVQKGEVPTPYLQEQCICQYMCGVLTGILAAAPETDWTLAKKYGLLVLSESLLNTRGSEKSMLSHFWETVDILYHHGSIVLEDCERVEVLLLSRTRVLLKGPSLPNLTVKLLPVLFTQGVSEVATLANLTWDTKIQMDINLKSLERLRRYLQPFHSKALDELFPLLSNLCHYQGNVKCVEIFTLLNRLKIHLVTVWRTPVLHTVSCKSAKDRTAMHVTRSIGELLQLYYEYEGEAPNIALLDCLRGESGCRLFNVERNVLSSFMPQMELMAEGVHLLSLKGRRGKYAFNHLQRKLLPYSYQPASRYCSGSLPS